MVLKYSSSPDAADAGQLLSQLPEHLKAKRPATVWSVWGKFTTRLLQWQWKSNLRVHSHSQTSAVRESTVIHDDATTVFTRLASQPVQLFSGKLVTAASFC